MNKMHTESNVGIDMCYRFSLSVTRIVMSQQNVVKQPQLSVCGKIFSVVLKLLYAGRWIDIWRSY